MIALAYMIPAITAVVAGAGIFAFCKNIRLFHKYMGFTLIFEGLFLLLAGYILSTMSVFSTVVFLLYYLMMLLSPFLYYFACRYFLKETGVKEKDFWLLEAVILFVILFAVVAGRVDPGDRLNFLRIVSGKGAMFSNISTGTSVLLSLDDIAFIFFLIELIFVQIFCLANIVRYKKLLETYYSNLEGKTADKMIVIFALVALRFVVFVCSNFVSISSGTFVIIQSAVFSLFYIMTAIYVCKIHYTAEELAGMIASQPADTEIRQPHQLSSAVYDAIDSRLERLITERFYLDSNIDLFTLSSKIQVNTKYVADYLKTKYGETFLYFVNRLRVEYAITLMEEKNDNLLDVAEQAGFISLSTFYRNFIKVKGVPPSEFKKKRSC